ncbi:MAG: hypothetical protein ABSE35_14080 [Bryobacteraceae bacterium]|jgi:hypothetical protein
MLVVLVFSGLVHGTLARIPLKSNVALNPSAAYSLTMDVPGPVEISWEAVQAKPCNTDCVQVTYLPTKFVFAARSGLGKYTPVDGKISVEYKNISSEPVTINIYRLQRTCDAEACQFLASGQKGRLLVYKVDEFKTITTSTDESYSVIAGTTTLGRPFRVRVEWWTDDKMAQFHCAQFIQRYLSNHTQKDQYRPYILSGMAIGEGNDIVLKSIDTCVPKAPNFGVADTNVLK